MTTVLIVYAQQKFMKWLHQKQPVINMFETENHYDSSVPFDLNALDFKIAFGVTDYHLSVPLQNDSIVRFNVFLEERKNLQIVKQTQLNFHVCSQEDFEQFMPVYVQNQDYAQSLIDQGALYCIDQGQDLSIRGTNEIDSVALNVDFIPCLNSKDISGCTPDLTLKDIRDYLGHPELVILSNQQRFDNSIMSDDCIVDHSQLWNHHIDKSQANWMQNNVLQRAVNDQIKYLSVGISQQREYIQHNFGTLGLSYSDNFDEYYKIAGFTVVANPDKITIERSVYDFLNFLRDVGGLNGILVILGTAAISKIATYVTRAYFVSAMFKQRKVLKVKVPDITDQNFHEELVKNFDNRKRIPFYNLFQTIFHCFFNSQKLRRYIYNRKRAEPQIAGEIDLMKIIDVQRMHQIQLRGLLNRSQRKFTKKLAERTIREADIVYETSDSETEVDGIHSYLKSIFKVKNQQNSYYLGFARSLLFPENKKVGVYYPDPEKQACHEDDLLNLTGQQSFGKTRQPLQIEIKDSVISCAQIDESEIDFDRTYLQNQQKTMSPSNKFREKNRPISNNASVLNNEGKLLSANQTREQKELD